MRILVVRMSSLGDVVHTIPVVAALRRALPDAHLDWLVDGRYGELVELVPVVDHVVAARASGRSDWRALPGVVRMLRTSRYDVALDLQGLLRSAAIARLSGARRVIGFKPAHLREPMARFLYTEAHEIGQPVHVVEKSLALAGALGARSEKWEFPISEPPGATSAAARDLLGMSPTEAFVLINPGSAWSSKCWPPERYGALAARLSSEEALRSVITWGPGEEARAQAVADASSGAAMPSPPTSLVDLIAIARAASIVVAGDTGPLHIAAAVGTPVVGVYGPSDPRRNGPWDPLDDVVSPRTGCRCQSSRVGSGGVVVRRCVQSTPCLSEISVEDVAAAVARRLHRPRHA